MYHSSDEAASKSSHLVPNRTTACPIKEENIVGGVEKEVGSKCRSDQSRFNLRCVHPNQVPRALTV